MGMGSWARTTRTFDADGDGDCDVAMLTDSGLEIALNQSIHRTVEPTFTEANPRRHPQWRAPACLRADFDRDGETDVAGAFA